jgi:ASC-1-like (ASCH) protein
MRRMFFKQKYLRHILEGRKPLEGRVGYDGIKKLKVGDFIYLNGEYKAQITDIKRYPTFKDAVDEKNYKLLIPEAHSVEETLKVYEGLFPLWKQRKLGVYILGIKYPV